LTTKTTCDKIRALENAMKRMQPMTADQLTRLRQTAAEAGPKEACFIALLTHHFIRCSELAGSDAKGNPTGIKVQDVNLADGTIRITRLKRSISTTEALRGERMALESWLKIKPESPWLFPGRNADEPMDRKSVYNLYRSLCQRAGIPATSSAPHASRHTLGTDLTRKGAPMKLVQQAGGWKSIVAAAKYQELTQAHVDAEVARLLEVA
jgi:integrase